MRTKKNYKEIKKSERERNKKQNKNKTNPTFLEKKTETDAEIPRKEKGSERGEKSERVYPDESLRDIGRE